MSGGGALACSVVSGSHSASGAFVRNFAEGWVWFGAAPLGGSFALTEWVEGFFFRGGGVGSEKAEKMRERAGLPGLQALI